MKSGCRKWVRNFKASINFRKVPRSSCTCTQNGIWQVESQNQIWTEVGLNLFHYSNHISKDALISDHKNSNLAPAGTNTSNQPNDQHTGSTVANYNFICIKSATVYCQAGKTLHMVQFWLFFSSVWKLQLCFSTRSKVKARETSEEKSNSTQYLYGKLIVLFQYYKVIKTFVKLSPHSPVQII